MLFRGSYGFLSNFCTSPITVNGLTFSCVEAAFQAAKTLNPAQKQWFVSIDGSAAKRLGRRVSLRPDWEAVKLGVMLNLLRKKFYDPKFAAQLVAVTEPIVEENYWGDTFWGVCNGRGLNWLGQLLSQVRQEIIDGKKVEIL